MDNQMSLSVDILGDSSSVVSAADKAGSAIKGFENVSDTAIASLTAAIEKLDIDFTSMGGSAVKSSADVAKVGESAAATTGLLLGAIATTLQLCAQEAGDVSPDMEARIHDRILAECEAIVDSAMDMAFNVSEAGARYPDVYAKLCANAMEPIAAKALTYGQKYTLRKVRY